MGPQKMLLFSALFCAMPLTSMASTGTQTVPAPLGEYRVVAVRSDSNLTMMSKFYYSDLYSRSGRHISFCEGSLAWLYGETCKLWSVREAEASLPVITRENRELSDLLIPPTDSGTSSGNKRVNLPVDLICQDDGEQKLGSFTIIDSRVLVVSIPMMKGSIYLILERPLTKEQITTFQTRLKEMKFYKGEITGELDHLTLESIGFYAVARGSKSRFRRTAITENLLDGLGVMDERKSDDKATFPDCPPIHGADDLRDD